MVGADDALDSDPDEKESSEVEKHEAWLAACRKNTASNIERVQAAASRLGQLSDASPNKAGTAVERFLLERLLLDDERAHLARSRAAERDKLQLEQLRQVSAFNQRATQGAPQPGPAAFQPGVASLQLQQPVQQTSTWPTPSPPAAIAEQATQPPVAASGFRAFSITGRAKPPT